jgi:hypothetical protein
LGAAGIAVLPRIASAVTGHPALAGTPDAPGEDELLHLLRRAY